MDKERAMIFLGGCTLTDWRPDYLEKLDKFYDMFNPIVPDWTPDCVEHENKMRDESLLALFTITGYNPYSLVELTDCSHTKKGGTLAVMDVDKIREEDEGLGRSMQAIKELLERNGVVVKKTHDDMIQYLIENQDNIIMMACLGGLSKIMSEQIETFHKENP